MSEQQEKPTPPAVATHRRACGCVTPMLATGDPAEPARFAATVCLRCQDVRVSPVALRNILAREIMKPAAARVAPLPRVSDYARRLGYVPEPIRQRMPRPA